MIAQVAYVKHYKYKKYSPSLNENTFPFLHLKATCDFQSASTNRLTDNIPQEMLAPQSGFNTLLPALSRPLMLRLCKYICVAYLLTCFWVEQITLCSFLDLH